MQPHICHICSKSFNNRGNLNIHLRIHTGERPYKCKICDKAFKTEGQIRHHLISHSNGKHFQCPHCSKFYKRKGVLKAHMLIHMDDPSFILKKEYYDKIVENLDNKSFISLFDSYIIRTNNSKNTSNNSSENKSHIDWEIDQQIESNNIYNELSPIISSINMNSFLTFKNNDLKTENLNIIRNDDDNGKNNIFNNSLIKVPRIQFFLESSNIADSFQVRNEIESKDEKDLLSLSDISDGNIKIDINNYLILEDKI